MIIGVSNRKDIICSPQAAGFWKGRKCIMSKKIINFLRKYKYMILVLYFPIYMLWFNWLERRQVPHFAMIHCRLDDKKSDCFTGQMLGTYIFYDFANGLPSRIFCGSCMYLFLLFSYFSSQSICLIFTGAAQS